MLDVFLCHSKASRSVAETIAGRLELCAEAKVWREETNSSSTLIDVWEGGLSSAAIVLVLDPEAVPRHATRDAWEPILNHVSRHTDPPIGCVRLGSAACPRLLERTNFHEWQNEPLPVLRALDEWIISLHTPPVANTFEPARLPWFESRNTELNQLWHDLVDSGGATLTLVSAEACGKTALAQEFARRASSHFRDIVWIGCGERSAASILGELADQLGTQEPGKIPQLLAEHRLLVILDDLRGALPVTLHQDSRSSVLITTRGAAADVPGALSLEPLTNLPDLESPTDPDALMLWYAMSVCTAQGFPLQLPGNMIGMETMQARRQFDALMASKLAEPLDRTRVRLSEQSRRKAQQRADVESLRRKHAASIHAAFCAPSSECHGLINEIQPALLYCCDRDWPKAKELGLRSSEFLRRAGRNAEAAEVMRLLLACASRNNDADAVHMCKWELSWLVNADSTVRLPMAPKEQLQLAFPM